MDKAEKQARWARAFQKGEQYSPETISQPVSDAPEGYLAILARTKLDTVAHHYRGGLAVDICCGTGAHLTWLAGGIERGIGVDFSTRFVDVARRENNHLSNLDFTVGDATALPLADGVAGLVFCLSAFYCLPFPEKAVAEFARVLVPGGRCIIDAGIRPSLNAIAANAHPDLPPIQCVTVGELHRMVRHEGLHPIEERVFQILPLWTDRPKWMGPLLHPAWRRLLERQVGGRMLDEWVSGLPLVRRFAFRHLLVCEKRGR